MQRDQFIDLRQCIRFDERETRNERGFHDKFASLRNIISPDLTIDEQLVTFRGCFPLKMFSPSKPPKYGLKVLLLYDSVST